MQFVNPYFLFGLFALAIPVIIHLFNFRKFKRVYFTNVRFIKDIQMQTQKQSRLKHWIILALRLLAVAALVLAFAQPYIPLVKSHIKPEAASAVSIYVDNSFSMEAQSERGQLLDLAKMKAEEIASAYKASDLYQLLTNDFEGIHQHLNNRDIFIELLDDVETSPVVRKLSEVSLRQSDMLSTARSKNKLAFLLSDFQKSSADVENLGKDTSVQIFLVPLKANKTPNIYIDTCWFESPVHLAGQNVKLHVRLKNPGEQDYEKVPLKLVINSNQKAVSSVNLPAHSETTVVLSYNDAEPGIRYGTLDILDSPINYDDTFFFSYTVHSAIPVLTIDNGTPNIYLNSLFGKDSAISYTRTPERSVDYSSFGNFSLIILDGLTSLSTGLTQEIQKFLNNGGSILLIPGENMDTSSYSTFFTTLGITGYGAKISSRQPITKINLEHEVYNDVFDYVPENIDLPSVFTYYQIRKFSRSGLEPLLTLQNGDAFLGVQPAGAGKVYLLASPLNPEFTSLPRHAVYVPTFFKIALLSIPQNRLFYTLGAEEIIEYRNGARTGDKIFKVKQLGRDYEFIPEHFVSKIKSGILVHDQIRTAGHYTLMDNGSEIMGISFNYNRNESNLDVYSVPELKEITGRTGAKNITVLETSGKSMAVVMEELSSGIRLWKLFIIFALVFLALEVILLRFWK